MDLYCTGLLTETTNKTEQAIYSRIFSIYDIKLQKNNPNSNQSYIEPGGRYSKLNIPTDTERQIR